MSKQIQISILGSTGSIGTQALDIIRNYNTTKAPEESISLEAISAGRNIELFIEQIKEFKPKYAAIVSKEHQNQIKELFPELKILESKEALAEIPVDIFISAIVGIAGLEANLKALQYSKRVAIANKETIVCAPHLVDAAINKYGSELIPIDSEHAAIHQCLLSAADKVGTDIDFSLLEPKVEEILLTSSGGPFRTLEQEKFKNITIEEALNHPTWKMGPKITIDSSTLVNKGLEVIEAHALFKIPYDKIKVIIHPQSIVHSAVKFVDGNTITQMGTPNMRVPIQYAMFYPNKHECFFDDNFDITTKSTLEFYQPDTIKFPALDLAYQAGRAGHSMPTIFNSANEVAVERFLGGKIHYLDIATSIEAAMASHTLVKNPSLEDILQLDQELRSADIHSFTSANTSNCN